MVASDLGSVIWIEHSAGKGMEGSHEGGERFGSHTGGWHGCHLTFSG